MKRLSLTRFELSRKWIGGIILSGLMLLAVQCGSSNPTVGPTLSPKPISTSTPTPTPTYTATADPGSGFPSPATLPATVTETNPPKIIGFKCEAFNPVLPDKEICIQVDIKRNGHKIDNFRWIVSPGHGTIVGPNGQSTISYRAPSNPGRYNIYVQLEYKAGPPVTGMMVIEVAFPTPTLTPTDTSATPTPTVTPSVTLTYTPTPIPADAITSEDVDLRTGPAENYDLIQSLAKGTKLDILRSVVNNEDWIKVRYRDGSDFVEGYVLIDKLQINKDLVQVPSIYEYGPHLIEPKPNEQRAHDHFITFKWENKGLQEGQCYSLILYRTDLGPGDACFHFQYPEKQGGETHADVIPSEFEKCRPGVYYWSVGIATPKDGEPCGSQTQGPDNWRDDSEIDERNIIGLSVVPPTNKPINGEKPPPSRD